ncbi:calcium-activated potassium channel subunit beta-1 [Ambystoma mexicanum]|uniref:calcium-activated potassium channel subunit beta-1 n=1 Tax=Ambystoma mexicanum TaxID=8296 RepID=UPI0037E9C855
MSRAEIRMGKKQFTAQKRGETRIIYLGLGMILCSVMMSFVLGFTLLPPYISSARNEESECTLIQATVEGNDSWSSHYCQGCCSALQYPCLRVLVKWNSSRESAFLYHTEDTSEISPKCSYIPKCSKNYTELEGLVNEIANNFRKQKRFLCYRDPEWHLNTVILKRHHTLERLLLFMFWPAFMLICGTLIVLMVKLSHHFSKLAAQNG